METVFTYQGEVELARNIEVQVKQGTTIHVPPNSDRGHARRSTF